MSYSSTQILGNLGADPDLGNTNTSGKSVTTLSVATNEKWTDREGNAQERTEWHRIVLFGPMAENACKYLKKGSQVFVVGRLRTRQWEKDGESRYTTEIVASTVQFLDRPNGTREEPPTPDDNDAPF